MKTQDYHIYSSEYGEGIYRGNVSRDDIPLILNCAGSYSAAADIFTDAPMGRHDYYLLYVAEGCLHMSHSHGNDILTGGHFVIFPPDTPYSYRFKKEERSSYLWVHFTGSEAREKYERYGIKSYPHINKITADAKITSRFNSIFDSFANADEFRTYELALLLERLFISLGRRISADSSEKSMKRSIGFMHASYSTRIKTTELARLENLSISRYNMLFKAALGVSPGEYLCSIRMSAACELLSYTDIPIKEVSINTGFEDPHFFSRIFKKKIGVSPIEYRQGKRREARELEQFQKKIKACPEGS